MESSRRHRREGLWGRACEALWEDEDARGQGQGSPLSPSHAAQGPGHRGRAMQK